VIQPLEDALRIQLDGTLVPPGGTSETDTDDEDDTFEFEDEKAAFEPFNDFRKRRFLWYYESYMQAIESAAQKVKPQEKFKQMSFEYGDNTMTGSFNYPELKRRLLFIKDTIANETKNWAVEGLAAKQRESRIAVNLQRQYEQVVEDLQMQKVFAVNLETVDGNPFVWELTYLGRQMTSLEGGMIKIRTHMSPRFPEEQPRVFVETPIFHHRISKDGVLCYLPRRTEEMRHHIEAIVAALEDESPPYDPRTLVNLEASKLFWGSAEEKKKYSRALRRSVERSVE
jgi:ubiquitin-conjugating enzyme E2 Z